MYIQISLTIDVGEQDTIKNAIDFAQNHLRTMDEFYGIEKLIDMMVFETNIHPNCMLNYLSLKSRQRSIYF